MTARVTQGRSRILGRAFVRTMFMILIGVFVTGDVSGAQQERTWWNEDWLYRKKITLDTTVTGGDIQEVLNDFPLLIRLHSGNFNFLNVREDGADIRLVSSDDTTPLKYHIESFDTVDEIALLWVKVPRIPGGSAENFVWMYYGNEKAIGGQDAGGTYDVNQILVYHLGETEGLPRDQTAYGNHAPAFNGTPGLPAIIGRGCMLNGGGEKITVASSPAMDDFSGGFSFSAWIRISQPQADAYLCYRQEGSLSLIIGVDQTKVYGSVIGPDGQTVSTEKTADLALDTWTHLTITVSPDQRMTVYVNGLEATWSQMPSGLPLPKGETFIGASAEGDHSFGGDLDEVNVSKIPLSAGRISALFKTQGPEPILAGFGEEEICEGGGGQSYFISILQNVTLDGWVVIVILWVMGVASWVVMAVKTIYIIKLDRVNSSFLEAFRGADKTSSESSVSPAQLSPGGNQGEFEGSSLFAIYETGVAGIRQRLAAGRRRLSRESLDAVRSTLDAIQVRENQTLNRLMVLLTIAISGGPFLGLLGTVVGVMITFAAIAASGDVNVNAIAPGIAAALVATVAGLAVAIPALFGYNYLNSRIKSVSADMHVFIDEFMSRAAEEYGSGNDSQEEVRQ